MYEPKLGRFLSRDPLPENGVELLYPFPDLTRYAYVRNNPVNEVDPSGLQGQRPGQCCACDMAIGALPDYKKTYVGPKGRTCTVELECQPSCPRNLIGYTAPPAPRGKGYVIRICISCGVADKSLDAVIAHELEHAKRFCNVEKGIVDCRSCLIQEEEAYKISCKQMFPNPRSEEYKRCVACGKFLGCGGLKADDGKGGPCIQDPGNCGPKDVGVEVK